MHHILTAWAVVTAFAITAIPLALTAKGLIVTVLTSLGM